MISLRGPGLKIFAGIKEGSEYILSLKMQQNPLYLILTHDPVVSINRYHY